MDTDPQDASAEGAVTLDRFVGGRLVMHQPRRGYRAGADAVLLSAAVTARPGERVLELGCGAGVALCATALRAPDALFTGIERDPGALALAQRNVAANGLAARVTVIEGDAARRGLAGGPWHQVFTNPPFFDGTGAIRAPLPARHAAWISDAGLGAWIDAGLAALVERGTLTLIHRADRLADILAALSGRAGDIAIRAVRPFAEAPAKRVLVRAVKTARAPLRLLPDIVLHPSDGSAKHLPHAEALLRGEATIDWD
jgi:tRNA1(Val) A37 N6-methylase TrmN6